jgi:hypothetical protein
MRTSRCARTVNAAGTAIAYAGGYVVCMRTSPFSAVLTLCLRAAGLDWSEIDPSIFGTLFVRGLGPGKRSETGAEPSRLSLFPLG